MPTEESKQLAIKEICERVKQKRKDYILYDFTRKKNDILKTFFDLAQEYETLKDLYLICVAVPLEFMQVDSRLYLLNDSTQDLELVCDSQAGVFAPPKKTLSHIRLSEEPYETEKSYVVPVFRKDFKAREFAAKQLTFRFMGMFELYPKHKLSKSDRFFFAKYTNRIGYNIYNRKLSRQNIRHLKFINNLVVDIEHNVIIPNMHFRYLFRKLEKKIQDVGGLEVCVRELVDRLGDTDHVCKPVIDKISGYYNELMEYHHELQKHHAHMSLFLESLFRRDHFEQGHLVLRPRKCLVEQEIIAPQLEHYESRLKARGIAVDRPEDMVGEEVPLMVDVGLLAQVYANLFSNAVKYTEAMPNGKNGTRKSVAYGREIIRNYFGKHKDGIKFNVFTTGKHLRVEEREAVFSNGYRRESSQNLPGTGHGLSFIKHVIEIHAGEVGYEPTRHGNNFYFILPLPHLKYR